MKKGVHRAGKHDVQNKYKEVIKMDLEQEINRIARQKIMQEINGLGIRAAIREEIEKSGITKGKVNELVKKRSIVMCGLLMLLL